MNQSKVQEFKQKMINGALAACEKRGYPTSDEPLCLIVEDVIDATIAFAEENGELAALVANAGGGDEFEIEPVT